MLIDKEGRIFHRWNVIDFIVVVFIIFIMLMPIVYFGVKIMAKKSEPVVRLTIDKTTYEKYKKDKARLERLDIWLKEHKRMRKHFE